MTSTYFKTEYIFGSQYSPLFFNFPVQTCGEEYSTLEPLQTDPEKITQIVTKVDLEQLCPTVSWHELVFTRKITMQHQTLPPFNSSELWEESREKMLKIAFDSNNIFSISFKPKNPTKYQALLLKNNKCEGESYSESFSKVEAGTTKEKDSLTPSEQPTKIVGFLKPYPRYSSKDFAPDESFKQIPPKKPDECDFSDVQPPELRETLTEILRNFEEDYEAEEIALIYFQPQDASNPVRKLRVKKATPGQ